MAKQFKYCDYQNVYDFIDKYKCNIYLDKYDFKFDFWIDRRDIIYAYKLLLRLNYNVTINNVSLLSVYIKYDKHMNLNNLNDNNITKLFDNNGINYIQYCYEDDKKYRIKRNKIKRYKRSKVKYKLS